MLNFSDRTASFTDSVIRRMTRISNRYNAVNLSQGFPDFDPPAELTQALAEAAAAGPHQYSITWGAQNFREALAEKQFRFTGIPYDPESEIVVTCGSTEAMMCAMMSVVNPGDKVAVFSPFYENYGADAILSGAEPIYVPLRPPAFDFDPEAVRMSAENFTLNKVSEKIELSVGDAGVYPGRAEKYDLVCANILGHLLITFRFNIVKWLKPDAHLVLAGILEKDFDRVSDAFAEAGLVELERETIREWTGGVFRLAK